MSPYTMDDVLKDETLFREKFCAEATFTHLGKVPVEALRAAIQMVHGCSVFRAASTPINFGGVRGDMPVVIFGNLTSDGRMRSPRFGLTTQCSTSNQPPGEKLFLYVSNNTLRGDGADKVVARRVVSSWLPWRGNTTDPSRVMPVPVYEGGRLLDASFVLPGSYEGVTLGGLLYLLGSQLKLRPEVRAEFADITEKLNLVSDCIAPKAVEIMRARRR